MPMYKPPPLQPLRIPVGWTVEQNDFYEVEPKFKSWDDTSSHFKEDMVQLTNERRGVIIDLGWYPEMRSTGRFRLVAVRAIGGEGGDWDDPMRAPTTRSKSRVVRTLEQWLESYTSHAPTRRDRDR